MNRSTLLLIGLLLVLGAIALFLLPSENERDVSDKQTPVSIKIDSSAVVKIEIVRPAKSVTLENEGGRWTITAPPHYPADAAAVFQLIGGLSNLKVGSLISSNPEKPRLFQVDSAGTRLTVTERGGASTSLIVGKMGPSFSEVYLRLPASKDVYLAEGIESWSLTKDVREWRDKNILTLPSESIKGLDYSLGGREYSYTRDSTGWKSGDKSVETSVMNPLLNTLSNLRADDFIDTSAPLNGKPIVISIRGPEMTRLNLYPSFPDSSKYYVQSTSGRQVFVINKWTAEQLLKPVEKSLPQKPAPPLAAKGRETPERAAMKPRPKPPVVTTTTDTGAAAPPKVVIGKMERKNEQPASVPQPSQTQTRTPLKVKMKPPASASQTQPKSIMNQKAAPAQQSTAEEDGDLMVYTVKEGETMFSIAQTYHVTVDQIKSWNLLKTTAVRPGQELYIYKKK